MRRRRRRVRRHDTDLRQFVNVITSLVTSFQYFTTTLVLKISSLVHAQVYKSKYKNLTRHYDQNHIFMLKNLLNNLRINNFAD